MLKAEAALITAIEAYNKPDAPYREETFAILVLNAWELLLKAKLVHEAKNRTQVLHVYEPRQSADGTPTKRLYLKRNRSGNPHTHSVGRVITLLENDHRIVLDRAARENLDALTEIRDNAIHYVAAGPSLAKRVLEIGTAAVKNFAEYSRLWFRRDLSGYSLYLMPIGFVRSPKASAIVVGHDEQRLVNYLVQTVQQDAGAKSAFHVALEVDITLKRVAFGGVAAVRVTRDPAAPEVQLTEEDILKSYPWDYAELTRRLQERYSNFKANGKYHTLREPLKAHPGLVRVRFLDPGNPKSGRKEFFSPNIVAEFDKEYTRR